MVNYDKTEWNYLLEIEALANYTEIINGRGTKIEEFF